MPAPITTRRAGVADIDRLLVHVQAGLDTYVEFAPAGWVAPQASGWREGALELLGDPDTWALLALADDESVGHVSFYPGRERSDDPHTAVRSRPPIPGLAHFWQLFVLPAWWGRGIAPMLHDRAIEEIRGRGYERARLFTPGAHVRARRFYERRGWSIVGEEWNDGFGLTLCEYGITFE